MINDEVFQLWGGEKKEQSLQEFPGKMFASFGLST